jgi:hypothetical protein
MSRLPQIQLAWLEEAIMKKNIIAIKLQLALI